MNKLPLLVTLQSVKADPALQVGERGARKIGVTSIYPGKEKTYDATVWNGTAVNSPVMLFEKTEFAVFNQITVQDRHYHKEGTEFYSVLDGQFNIEVESVIYTLQAGDTIVIPAGVIHEVHRDTMFTASVITVGCGGLSDKYVVEK